MRGRSIPETGKRGFSIFRLRPIRFNHFVLRQGQKWLCLFLELEMTYFNRHFPHFRPASRCGSSPPKAESVHEGMKCKSLLQPFLTPILTAAVFTPLLGLYYPKNQILSYFQKPNSLLASNINFEVYFAPSRPSSPNNCFDNRF